MGIITGRRVIICRCTAPLPKVFFISGYDWKGWRNKTSCSTTHILQNPNLIHVSSLLSKINVFFVSTHNFTYFNFHRIVIFQKINSISFPILFSCLSMTSLIIKCIELFATSEPYWSPRHFHLGHNLRLLYPTAMIFRISSFVNNDFGSLRVTFSI